MKRIFLLLSLLACFLGSQAATIQHDTLVHFASDQAELTAEARARLEAFILHIGPTGDVEFSVSGHTDSDAGAAYNEDLALRRSHAVRKYLLALGVPAETIRIAAFGERSALASNAEEVGQALNRRVQVTAIVHHWETTEELRARLRNGAEQHFTIDPTSAQSVTTATGATVRLEALSLVDADGNPVTGPVQLHVTDAISLHSIVGHALSTRCGDQLIETAGMLKVEAADVKGTPLELDPAKPMTVALPADEQKDGMQLFVSDDGSDWSTPPSQASTLVIPSPMQYMCPPELKRAAMKKLIFRSALLEPRKPVEPAHPRKPLEPARARYTTTWHWWDLVSKEKQKAEDELRYARAMEEYRKRLGKYEQQVKRYETECAAYPEALDQYAVRMAAYREAEKAEYQQWLDEVMRPEMAAYAIRQEAIRPYNDSVVADWRAQRDSAFAAYALRADGVGTGVRGEALNGYVLSTSRLGWINCDRFDATPGPKSVIAFADPDQSNEEVFLVFTRIRSMLRLDNASHGRYRSPRVPDDQPAVLFAYKVENGRPMLCHQPVDRSQRMALDFKPSSFAQITKVLRELEGPEA